jgi:uncharacterized protein
MNYISKKYSALAPTVYTTSTVTSQRFLFEVEGVQLVGCLFLPSNVNNRWPAVVVSGPMTSVKEQVTGSYARALAERGIAALTFDHRHFGESGGFPRQYEYAARKIEDLRAAITHLSLHDSIDPEHIGAVGVCLGCGYVAHAVIENPLVKAIGLVVGYYRAPIAMRERDSVSFDAKVAQGVAARELYKQTGYCETIPAASSTGDAAMQTADTVDYYTNRAAEANYVNGFAVMSREHFLPFDVQAAASKFNQPALLIHSNNALSPDWARDFYEKISTEKSIHWIESKGQTDVYDDPILVSNAVDLVVTHLKAYL